MRVYFVRHGRTLSNTEDTVQGENDALSPEGEAQAIVLAERFKHISFGALISSDLLRAKETTAFIEKECGVKAEYSPLFREVRRPSTLIGTSRGTEEYKDFIEAERTHVADKEWRYGDGENYFDIHTRATEAVNWLEARNEDVLVVVTHANFLRFLAAYVLTEKTLSPELWLHLGRSLVASNTGITTCVFEEGVWKLVTWNDLSHFAE